MRQWKTLIPATFYAFVRLRRAPDSCLKGADMPTPSPITPASFPFPAPAWLMERLKPFLAPYYLIIGAALGAITAAFVALTVVLILIATNFNVLSLIE